MKTAKQPTEIELGENQWNEPLAPINSAVACIHSNYVPKAFEPENLSVTERKLFEVNPRDHEWRQQFFTDLPEYLTKYFAKRYIDLFKKDGSKIANTYLREKMQPASERVR